MYSLLDSERTFLKPIFIKWFRKLNCEISWETVVNSCVGTTAPPLPFVYQVPGVQPAIM